MMWPTTIASTKALTVASVVAIERRVVQLGKRRLRHDAKQQRRQRNVEQEEIHPAKARFRQPLCLAAGETDEDQAEIGKRKVEDIGHRQNVFSSVISGAWRRKSPPCVKVNSSYCP
jgi:hypothetical protein